MNKSEKALNYFNNEFNCAQSVLTSFADELELTEDQCLKVACAFGGGMGKQQHVCGAVTGALMALGLKFGKALNDPEEQKQFTYSKADEFLNVFKNENGSINCIELLQGLDMNDTEQLEEINKRRLFEINCEKYVSDAVKIVEKLMKKNSI